MGKLENKVAVITGGTRGLGFVMAKAFASDGAAVVLASRSQKSVNESVSELEKAGAKASGISVDAGDLSQVEELASHAVNIFGKLDIWVNNAGVAAPYGPTIYITPEDFQRVVQTNILGVYYGSRTAMRYFLHRGSGKLINMLGRGDRGPVPYQNAYSSSKSWVRSFTLALAKETKDSGVGVFAYNPGMVLTELLTKVEVIEGSEDRLKVFPMVVRMLAKPPELPAKKAVWIASAATDGKTGKVYSYSSKLPMFASALGEGMRMLFRRPGREVEIEVTTVPAAEGTVVSSKPEVSKQ